MEGFTSKALLANLAQTSVKEVRYHPRYNLFLKIFGNFPALKAQVEELLKELFHPYRNSPLVLEELRSFFLKNLSIILAHNERRQGYWLVFDLLFKFFGEDRNLNIKTAEAIFSVLEKTVSSLNKVPFSGIEKAFKEVLKAIYTLPEHYFLCFLENYYSFKRLIKKFPQSYIDRELEGIFSTLLKRSFILTYGLWQKITEGELDEILKKIERPIGKICFHSSYFAALIERIRQFNLTLEELLEFPDHLDLLRDLKGLIVQIISLDEKEIPEDLKLLLLFKFIETPVLKLIHEELIREVNKLLISLIDAKSLNNLDEFLIKFFRILKKKLNLYPWTALECIKNIGIRILNKQEVYLTEVLINEIIKFGFQPPDIKGIDVYWKIKQNPNHLLNIKTWLEIFKVNPEWCSSLLAALILNLKLYGISIKDTDLFQKEITALLNAPIKPVYNLVKQFCKLLPVYYNEIGAEGKIRDISTEIDELFKRRDTLLHFLRKFIHIENSSLAVDFIKDIFRFWYSLDGRYIKKYFPDILYQRIVNEELRYHQEVSAILHSVVSSPEKLEEMFSRNVEWLKKKLLSVKADKKEKRKILLLFSLYKLEYQKYYQALEDLEDFISHYSSLGFEFVKEIKNIVEGPLTPYQKADKLLNYLKELKENIILSEKSFTPLEEVLVKRHVAVDIPSMYGRYREKKFDALGLTFRLERLVDKYLQEVVEGFNQNFVIRSSLFKILKILKLFQKALEVDGVFSQKFSHYLRLLESSLKSYPLSYAQYIDIFKGLTEGVQHIVKVYYTNPFLKVFPLVYSVLDKEKVVEKYRPYLQVEKESYLCLSEVILREIISSAFVLTHLDNFLKRIYQILVSYKEKVDPADLPLLLSYDKRRSFSFIQEPNHLTVDLLYLGNKAYNLVMLASEKEINVNVPYGFILTTEIFRCYSLIKKYKDLWEDYENSVREEILRLEKVTGKRFGSKRNPLILSLRSGASISMPGMMTSILNVGVNLEIIEGLAMDTGNSWFAWDTYRRFIQSWAMAYGIKRDFFNKLMREHKRKYAVKKKKEFTGEQMRELALRYKRAVEKEGIRIPKDPWEQLLIGIELILKSWNNEKAKAYRQIMQVAEDWGTAVIVQEMVFGNLGSHAGTGVTLTTSPVGKFPRILLWGDYTPSNQGEDIVSGLVNAFPISREQKKIEGREGPSLEEAFPEVYHALLDLAYYLVYEKKWGHQEIEFTFEGDSVDKLYILQVRDLILREDREPIFWEKEVLKGLEYIGRGIGVTGGLVSGRIAFELEDIERFKKQGDEVILVRYDTVPDNIKEIHLIDGILTARGGQTSHAAIVASRLGKVCVVGCEGLSIDESTKKARLNGVLLHLGDWITLNGSNGNIYKGKLNLKEVSHEARD